MRVVSAFAGKLLVGGVLACAAIIACATSSPNPGPIGSTDAPPLPQACNPDPTCPGSTCATAINPALAVVPANACPRFGEFQSDVDVYSWNTFIALNWPANPSSCTANTQTSILSGQGPTVWETYPDDLDMFVPPGSKPGAWCSFNTPAAFETKLRQRTKLLEPGRLQALNTGVHKLLLSTSKASAAIGEKLPDIEQAVGGPLTDQNGRFVRYEKRLNQDEYNYLITNNLWNAAGQKGVTISFPTGANQNPGPCNGKPCGPVGAMEVKASWKVLSPQEISGKRFFMRQAWVFNDDAGDPSPGANPVTVGLVGLHIIHKTDTQQTWFWSTFEHVDNTTSSFFNPHCTGNCTPNTQTAKAPYTELAPDGGPLNAPVQVTRTTPIQADAGLNAYYRALLKGSVWENYQLISTQWATGGAPQGTPPVLANTTMETYIQSTASCLGCHGQAPKASGDGSADFSFLLMEAQ
ncbi:hypothetical protein SAMN05443572_110102 [Myxococcus fulvus]|uniref:Cytochrome c family protein n=1 Tax=Myxococcus fulvus TaxID=33 RepID=A0A511T814_MYXFU|nr:hypothetical protein [Myxococcus fulvus]GEN10295.1 hypothetical protein MFU01_53320 [Myxococcus fulvus]SEU34669.1 hypothetical protein SAMN05443572_110102 [Myxococcus fulvus]